MNPAELERLIGVAEELAAVRSRIAEDARMRAEAAREQRVVDAAAPAGEVLRASCARLTAIARALERQWVAHAPAESAWQRAVELEQVAVAAGADAGSLHGESERLRAVVEAAWAQTRTPLDELQRERDAIATATTGPPIGIDPPPSGRRDNRPQAVRRDALELIDHAIQAATATDLLAAEAEQRLAGVRAELDRLAVDGATRARADELARALPARLELPAGTPPSVAARLRRAGVAFETAPA